MKTKLTPDYRLNVFALLLAAILPAQAQTIIRQETFETAQAQDDWYADNGVWQMGVPTYGPPPNAQGRRAYAGTNCAATVLGGDYANNVNSRLIWDPISPLVVPPADQNPRLRFMSWLDSYAGDYGQVLIKTNGGAWRNLSGGLTNYFGPGQAWNQTVLDLSAYANKTVQIAFQFQSDGGTAAPGWYVDEVTLVAGPIVPVVPNVAESFETGWGDWSVEGGGPWELGRPTSGPGSAHAGSNCVATTLGGNYPEGYNEHSVYPSRLYSPPVVVPPAGSNPRLRFWQYYSFNIGPDYGEVQIKVGNNAWQTLAHYEGNSSGVWTRPSFDLTAYAGQTVKFGFYFSHQNEGWENAIDTDIGWYVDEATIVTGAVSTLIANVSVGFESGLGDWYVDNGVWEIGLPTSGPATNSLGRRAYSGTNCAATVLGGNYANNVNSRLISPQFAVPAADQNPRLRFMSWLDSWAGDYGQVLIKTNGGAWRNLSDGLTNVVGPGLVWNQTVLDLSAYANKTVQIAFQFQSDGGTAAPGWYVDEVTLVAGPIVPVVPNVTESFETGWGDWSVEGGGPWELGKPTSGPGSAHAGTNCVATTLGGNYPEHDNDNPAYPSRLYSPPVVVPPAGSNPRLRFWQYYSFNIGPDYGEVQIKVGNNAWQTLAHYEGNSSGVWTRPSFDLTAYAGQTVKFGFYFSHQNEDWYNSVDTDIGWYVDEPVILAANVGPTIALYPTNQTVVVGNPAYFTTAASGTDPLSYQWRFNGTPIPNETNTSYVISSTRTNDVGNYDVVVTNLYGSATSSNFPAVLQVVIPASITTQPQSLTVDAGVDVTFTVVAAGSSPFTYQWYFNTNTLLPNATNAVLTLPAVQTNQSGVYHVRVDNAAHIATNSSYAVLTVNPVEDGDSIPQGAGLGWFAKTNNTYTVSGGGEDIEGTDDRFFFVHLPWTGDGEIMVNLKSLTNAPSESVLSEAGIMFRGGLEVGARHVFLAMNAGKQIIFRRRLAENAYSVENRLQGTNNVWLKLMRMGDTFTGHYSTNGVNWELVWWTTQTNMPATLDVGMAVTAHHNGEFATAVFEKVGPRSLTPLSGTWPLTGPKLILGGEGGGMAEFQRVGGFKALVGGNVGDRYAIKASPDVSTPFASWPQLGMVTNTYGVVLFKDAQALTNQQRFYRAVQQ